jgi:hypothetical protein
MRNRCPAKQDIHHLIPRLERGAQVYKFDT